jgi:hypothetical protein
MAARFMSTRLISDCNAVALRRAGVAVKHKEMCHEKIHRRYRVDLSDRHPDAQADCKRSPCVAVELVVREQRLLRAWRLARAFLLAGLTLMPPTRPSATREMAA